MTQVKSTFLTERCNVRLDTDSHRRFDGARELLATMAMDWLRILPPHSPITHLLAPCFECTVCAIARKSKQPADTANLSMVKFSNTLENKSYLSHLNYDLSHFNFFVLNRLKSLFQSNFSLFCFVFCRND